MLVAATCRAPLHLLALLHISGVALSVVLGGTLLLFLVLALVKGNLLARPPLDNLAFVFIDGLAFVFPDARDPLLLAFLLVDGLAFLLLLLLADNLAIVTLEAVLLPDWLADLMRLLEAVQVILLWAHLDFVADLPGNLVAHLLRHIMAFISVLLVANLLGYIVTVLKWDFFTVLLGNSVALIHICTFGFAAIAMMLVGFEFTTGNGTCQTHQENGGNNALSEGSHHEERSYSEKIKVKKC